MLRKLTSIVFVIVVAFIDKFNKIGDAPHRKYGKGTEKK